MRTLQPAPCARGAGLKSRAGPKPALTALGHSAPGSAAELTPADKQKIDQALPAKPAVKPQRARKLLLLNVNVNDTGRRPDVHASVPYGNYAIEEMGRKTGAYATVFSTDIESLRPENLALFDAICFNNTTGVLTTDPALRQSLLSFVAKGKGLVAFHAGGAATFVHIRSTISSPSSGKWWAATKTAATPGRPETRFISASKTPRTP